MNVERSVVMICRHFSCFDNFYNQRILVIRTVKKHHVIYIIHLIVTQYDLSLLLIVNICVVCYILTR